MMRENNNYLEDQLIVDSCFQMIKIMGRTYSKLAAHVSSKSSNLEIYDESESIICIKPEYKLVDDPAQYYACRDELSGEDIKLLKVIEEQGALSFLLLFLPDSRCKSL